MGTEHNAADYRSRQIKHGAHWRSAGFVLCLLLITPALALLALRVHMKTVHTYIGQTVQEFERTNASWFGGKFVDDNSPFIYPSNDFDPSSSELYYGRPGREIHFPPARLLWINQYGGVITAVTINTSARKETLEKVYEEASELNRAFQDAGWFSAQTMPSLEAIKQNVADSGGTSNGFGALRFTHGTETALILLSTPGAVITTEKSSQAAFVAEIEISDKALEKREADRVYAERKRVNGSDGVSLPLRHFLSK